MKTRKQYMDKEITHEEYYRQFVTHPMVDTISREFSTAQLKAAGEHLNGIALQTWDRIAHRYEPFIRSKMKEAGDCWSMAGGVCVVKQAARMTMEKVAA